MASIWMLNIWMEWLIMIWKIGKIHLRLLDTQEILDY